MEEFPNASAYCQQLKTLVDQLKNIGALVSNDRLILPLVAGLTDTYNRVGTLLRQSSPLPQFYQAHSMLLLEESGLAKKAATSAAAAMVATSPEVSLSSPPETTPQNHHNGGKKGNRGG